MVASGARGDDIPPTETILTHEIRPDIRVAGVG
jgi:hypothetical protein